MDLLIEIYSEEIPARMQRAALTNSQVLLSKLLTEQGLEFTEVGGYVAPQHLAIFAKGLPETTKALTEERRGPRLSAPEAAMAGFLKSTGMTVDQLEVRGDYYYANIVSKARPIEKMLPDMLHSLLDQMPWPKSMRWHNHATNDFTRSWIRPIRAITVMLDDKTISFPVKGLDLTTGSQTFGHRFMKPEAIQLNGLATYVDQLRSVQVLVDFEERRKAVWDAMTKAALEKNLIIQEDEALLDEVTGLVDFPYAHLGAIDAAFTHLPREVLSTSMRVHQKYFTLCTQDGQNAPYFGVLTNVPTRPDNRLMMDGLERVLRARLSDAAFFYNTDRAIQLTDLVKKLDTIIFHEKLGSIGDKVRRLEAVAPDAAVKRAAHLCKSDLVTQMVGEFPELQGIMGRIYATLQGEPIDVSLALEEYYQPLGPSKATPTAPVSRALALIDKMDTLVGFLGSGIKPTGSKDPLAIRRTALGIIRLIVEADADDVDLAGAITNAIAAYKAQDVELSAKTVEDVLEFIQLRFQVYIRERCSREIADVILGENVRISNMWAIAAAANKA
ncbi:MAG: glycine--tRNA ligase subunit beta [Candidatus Paracaedibacteraceae bacterium]|nr:glycine--tRNA ligase subunit beta [Candidatus Paracaedibacteraceae bacterium]